MSYQSLYKIFVQSNNNFNEIYKNRFESESTIKFPVEINNNQAFFFWHKDINILLNKIREYEKKINEIFNKLPSVAKAQYIKKSLIDEIHYTNQIEGVLSTRKDIFNILEDIKIQKKERHESIINKYNLLLTNKKIKLDTSQDLRNLYDELLLNEIKCSNNENLPDGIIFRNGPVHIYKTGEKPIHDGVYPEAKIISYIDGVLPIIKSDELNAYLKSAIMHYFIGYIHPFYDGNGRLARFISSYILSDCNEIIKYRLSMSIKENLSQYLDAFKYTNDVRNKGDISTFVYEFLDIILKAYQKTEIYALEKINALSMYKSVIDQIGKNDNEKNFIFYLIQCELFNEFGLSSSDVESLLKCSKSTINKYVAKFKKLNYIRVIKNGKYSYYSANLDGLIKNN